MNVNDFLMLGAGACLGIALIKAVERKWGDFGLGAAIAIGCIAAAKGWF